MILSKRFTLIIELIWGSKQIRKTGKQYRDIGLTHNYDGLWKCTEKMLVFEFYNAEMRTGGTDYRKIYESGFPRDIARFEKMRCAEKMRKRRAVAALE